MGARPLRADDGFNSRSRVGSDAVDAQAAGDGQSFNSRSRVGSDRDFVGPAPTAPVSIHAPV